MNYLRSAVILVLLAFFAGVEFIGCAYSYKAALPEYIHKIYIPVFSNRTTRFNIEGLLTDAVIQEFTSKGQLVEGGYIVCVNRREEADAVLEGEIVNYILENSVVDDKGVVQEYRVRILVNLTLTDLKQGKVLWSDKNRESKQRIFWKAAPAAGVPQTVEEAESNVFKALSNDIVNRTLWGW